MINSSVTKLERFSVSLLLAISALLMTSCESLGPPDIQHVQAEITEIKYHSDTSVSVSVEVLRNSNAEYACKFKLFVDTISIIRSYGIIRHEISNNCQLEKNYEVTVEGLKKGIPYYFRLHSLGSFDFSVGGGFSDTVIGKQWEYTIQ